MHDKIKVLHVAEAAGGVDRYLKTLFKYLNHERFETFFACSQNFKVGEYKDCADYVMQIPMQHDISVKDDLATINRIRDQIKKYKPDIVYAHSSKAGALTRMANMGMNNVLVYNPHGWSFNMRCSRRKKNEYILIEKVQTPFTDKIVCISQAEKNSAIKRKICKEDKVRVIENGIDFAEIDYTAKISREKLKIPPNAFVIGMVGRITDQKAPDVFVKAAEILKKKIPEAFFIIVGDSLVGQSDAKEKIQGMIDQAGLRKSFLITGWVDNPIAYTKQFDVGMLLSRWEGFGLVIPEYMYCGVPVVATSVDAIPYLINDGEDGLLVSVDDPASAADAVYRIWHDEILRHRLKENGRQKAVQRFDCRRVARDTEKLFIELNGKNKSTSVRT